MQLPRPAAGWRVVGSIASERVLDRYPLGAMNESEHQWATRIRCGDRQAFKDMFYAYYPGLCAFAAEYVGSYDRARDVVQEVFLTIWERRREWTLRGSLKAYLFQAVRNRALNEVRNHGTRRRAYDAVERQTTSTPQRTAEDRVYYRQLSEAVRRAVAQLPPRRRMVFLLHRNHGFSYAEIAQIMDITSKTVENQMGRALKSLRAQLSREFLSEL